MNIMRPTDRLDSDSFVVRFWGTRGSLPVSGAEYIRYGGNTACVEIKCGGQSLFFDAGSGMRPAGKAMLAQGKRDFDLFFTHCHYDHIVGLPFFAPLYYPGHKVTVWSGHLAGQMTTDQMLHEFVRHPWFPVNLDICCSKLMTRDFRSGDVLRPRPGIVVRTGSLNHPGGCIGYRIEYAGRAVVLISDTEHVEGQLDENILALIEGADLVIYDCTYTDDEMKLYRGYGHSTWQQGVRLCEAAGAKRLALYHHDPSRTDTMMSAIEDQARARFPGAFAAADGMSLEIEAVKAKVRKRQTA